MKQPVEIVLQRLETHHCRPRSCGSGWSALCPGHDDNHPSLSLAEGDDGKALLKCHAGCDLGQILGPLGLTENDLFLTHETMDSRPQPIEYDYRNEDGTLRFQIVREYPKKFKVRRPGSGDKWIYNIKGTEPILYRLPELLVAIAEGKIIFIVEGEKDVERLRSLGLAATTNPFGAGKWREIGRAHV